MVGHRQGGDEQCHQTESSDFVNQIVDGFLVGQR
jgi:hypothetical protein